SRRSRERSNAGQRTSGSRFLSRLRAPRPFTRRGNPRARTHPLENTPTCHRTRAMFTGLVEQMGTLLSAMPREVGQRLELAHEFAGLVLGESISVGGACLTLVGSTASTFAVDV